MLQQTSLENGGLSYSIETLEGTVPTQTGPVTLFIDPFGRPLSRTAALARIHLRGETPRAATRPPTVRLYERTCDDGATTAMANARRSRP